MFDGLPFEPGRGRVRHRHISPAQIFCRFDFGGLDRRVIAAPHRPSNPTRQVGVAQERQTPLAFAAESPDQSDPQPLSIEAIRLALGEKHRHEDPILGRHCGSIGHAGSGSAGCFRRSGLDRV